MNKISGLNKSIAVFALGFLAGSVVVGLFSNYSSQPPLGLEISGTYLLEELDEVCSELDANGCACKPTIKTNRQCKGVINDFFSVEMRKKRLRNVE